MGSMPPNSPSNPIPTESTTIVIIGAGVSGLTLSQGLTQNSIPHLLLERDASLTARTQGYRVRLTTEGLSALAQCLPAERYEVFERSCAELYMADESKGGMGGNAPKSFLDASSGGATKERLVFLGKPPGNGAVPNGVNGDGTGVNGAGGEKPGREAVQGHVSTEGKAAPVDRGVLRAVLREGLGKTVRFGVEVVEIVDGDGQGGEGCRVVCKGGEVIACQVVVGADGLRSWVRRSLVPGYELVDTGGRLVYGKTVLKGVGQELVDLVATRPGLTMIKDDVTGKAHSLFEPMHFDRTLKGVPLPEDYVYFVLFLPAQEAKLEETRTTEEEVRTLVKQNTQGWHPAFQELYDKAEMTFSKILSAHPKIPTWPSKPRITLMGDAIHAMSPTAAHGATSALKDAGVLLENLIAACSTGPRKPSFEEALQAYEVQMREYGASGIQRSANGGKAMFGMKSWEALDRVRG